MRFITGIGDALPWMVLAFVAAAVLSLVLTPAVRRLVMRHGMIDRPEARRVNVVPIPRAGGLAVAAAFLLVAAVFLFLNEQQQLGPRSRSSSATVNWPPCCSAGRVRPPSAPSTTTSTCGRAGSC